MVVRKRIPYLSILLRCPSPVPSAPPVLHCGYPEPSGDVSGKETLRSRGVRGWRLLIRILSLKEITVSCYMKVFFK